MIKKIASIMNWTVVNNNVVWYSQISTDTGQLKPKDPSENEKYNDRTRRDHYLMDYVEY